MARPTPLEQQVLEPAQTKLHAATAEHGGKPAEIRLEILEAVAARLGGFDLEAYRGLTEADCYISLDEARQAAASVIDSLTTLPMPAALALTSLARPPLNASQRRKTGAYYTDFRLAQHLAARFSNRLTPETSTVDPASGTGILLVAAVLEACGADREARATMLAGHVYASDLSESALRGLKLSLASLIDDLDVVKVLSGHLQQGDSLLRGPTLWSSMPEGFDLCLGNPPWEKLRVTKHELLQANGVDRHYGAEYSASELSRTELQEARKSMKSYVDALEDKYELLGSSGTDLYQVFTELAFNLVHDAGAVGLLVPAGLIRSLGTEPIRGYLFEHAEQLDFTILENRAKFFEIDTRFKFLTLVAQVDREGTRRRSPLRVRHAEGTDSGVTETGVATVGRTTLARFRDDLTVPEVRSPHEWRIFRRACLNGRLLGDPSNPWKTEPVREIDMSLDREDFVREQLGNHLPVVEGRMVQQYRFAAKRHLRGTGRRAKWETLPPGLNPPDGGAQFYYPEILLSEDLTARAATDRIGFCDITGQTNERSLHAALIPPGFVAGNKVPTITFDAGNDGRRTRLNLVYLAVANSTPFDWLLRRVVTTTVNFFLLRSLPFPDLDPDGLPARRLAELATRADLTAPADLWKAAEARAEIDVRVAHAYGLDYDDLELMLTDFNLLDRNQPPVGSEDKSTVTRDLILLTAHRLGAAESSGRTDRLRRRVEDARRAGAVPYVPSEAAAVYREVHNQGAYDGDSRRRR